MEKFTFIDLFAGIGGFRLALERSGGKCLGFSEINKDAIEFYCKNHNEGTEFNFGDITKVKSLPNHDVLVAGVPCQSWSIAGKNLGFDDDRGQLWNDTIYLLNQSRPKAFIFENVKGLVDPRNKKALEYILNRIQEAGYFVDYFVINSADFGVPQNRVRVYIIGFLNKKCFDKFKINRAFSKPKTTLADVLEIEIVNKPQNTTVDLFGDFVSNVQMSLSTTNGLNDYFLFNDLRNGHSTIHSWDLIETTPFQKEICLILLRNRRKSKYGKLDGNPLSLSHFKELSPNTTQKHIDELVDLEILKPENYLFEIVNNNSENLNNEEQVVLSKSIRNFLNIDELKSDKELKLQRINITDIIASLLEKGVIRCAEIRYDFKNTKISTGLFGINRVFLPTSDIFPTLVASDTNDFITNEIVSGNNEEEFKQNFINKVYKLKKYRKISKEEACIIQGFPKEFILPENRARWMKLVGNSVSVPVIEVLIKSIKETGVFIEEEILVG
jgi:DNA (cytosine-5)-methyltransferase 1